MRVADRPESQKIEELRLILEQEQCRPVSIEEAQEVANSLISFYEVLGAGDTEDKGEQLWGSATAQ
jgi:hypothetical protein